MRPFRGRTLQDVEKVNKVVMFDVTNTRDLLNSGEDRLHSKQKSKDVDKCAELTGIGCDVLAYARSLVLQPDNLKWS